MKRFTAILLLISLTFAQTELNQLLKIPFVFEHYFEHADENAALSIGDFFDIHYFSKQVKDLDYDQDMQLPFKTVNPQICNILSGLVPANLRITAAITCLLATSETSYSAVSIPGMRASIWQPPQTIC